MHPITPRPARRALVAAVTVPVMLVAGCTSDSGGEDSAGPSSASTAASRPEAVKYAKVPEACRTVGEKTVEDVVPGVDDASGKELNSSDTGSYSACLWSGSSGDLGGKYRALTVSLRRFESDNSLGTGDERAGRFLTQEAESVQKDDTNKDPVESGLDGLGQEAVGVTYETEKKNDTYRATRVVVRDHNVVATVDYEGAGFEDADPPSRDEVRKNAEKVAKEATAAIG
ncbi:DUF3558 domain-containing protein [Streptomyces sp. TR02-1]|uniref:DUF3558 domain-containing protein n=1 Tax=Streptomyces sp. TR02-1 TaxID=3385977 RepID=UPI0039A2A631